MVLYTTTTTITTTTTTTTTNRAKRYTTTSSSSSTYAPMGSEPDYDQTTKGEQLGKGFPPP